MKIVSLAEFLKMPPGTVFAKYEPCIFYELSIKDDSILESGDFYCQRIVDAIDATGDAVFFDSCHRAENGENICFDFHSIQRDGSFDPDQLFAVWDHNDISLLITRLQECLTNTANPREKI